MAEHDLHTIGTATFEEVSMIPRNILLRNQAVALGDIRYTSKIKSNLFLECTTAGTTSSTAVSFTGVTEGDTVTDGTVVWTIKKVGSGSGGFYGVCSTAAATAAKTVDCQGFKLEAGASVKVKFTYTNTASSPTLNVSSTGTKSIYSGGSAIAAGMLVADTVIEFVYDGTVYNMMGGGTAYNIPTTSGLGNIWIE